MATLAWRLNVLQAQLSLVFDCLLLFNLHAADDKVQNVDWRSQRRDR